MNPSYPLVASRARHRCEYCHAPEVIFNFPFEVEHIIPPALGGRQDDSNLALSCRVCNLRKGTQIVARDPDSHESVSLFDPRKDDWDLHFRVDPASGTVVGLTPTGRATAARLEFNAPTQTNARLQ